MNQALSATLDAKASSARFARTLANTFVRQCGFDDLLETTGLLVSELVTNSVLHAGSGIRLEIAENGQGVRVDVFDASTSLPVIGPPDPLAESGRGLHLVDSLADEWGSERLPDGKVTWFVLADTHQGAS